MSIERKRLKPELLFPTPIWMFMLADHGRINLDILSVLEQLENDSEYEAVSRSNIGGWHSKANLHQREELAEITRAIGISSLECAHSQNFDVENFELSITDMWLNKNGKGDFNKVHIHPHGMLSGVYYVQVPPDSGCIEFFDPVIARTMTTFPKIKTDSAHTGTSTIAFDPVEGRLIVFPSWLQHWVQPNKGSGDRVSISFNVGYRPKKEKSQEV